MKTSSDVLEYESLRQLLTRYVSSPAGRRELDKVQPYADRGRLTADLAETAEAIEYLRTAARPQPASHGAAIRIDFSGLPDLDAAAHKLHIEGASLDPREIFDLFVLLDRSADAKSVLTAAEQRFPKLARHGQAIGDFRGLLKEIDGKILPDGTVSDHASVALARVRRDIERQKKAIQDSLERFLKAHKDEGILQEEFVTIRNERFVVPLIAGQRRKMDGVIHGTSSSGHTLFVEPLETIDLNNELVRLSEEEAREVHRILLELTDRLRGHADSVAQTLVIMAELELIFGKARFATDFDCVTPRFGDRLLLREARHPLLQDVLRRRQKKVVPISLELTQERRTLLISGPNTGGKTVTLKTVGLLSLMAQSALPVPAAEAEFPVFEQVLADIGDYQSIQENLSTFSAHVSNIREMALDVTPDSLVLLDELGAATDPEEGGALGVAIVEHFRGAGAFTLVSTHLLALKIYGASTEGVVNGSMGFDEQTLEPTYELRLGLPGKSAGLEIATRLGMPEDIMLRARRSMSDRERDVTLFLNELHRRIEETHALEREMRQKIVEAERREKEVAREWEKRESAKLKELERRTDQALARFDEQAQETLGKIAQYATCKKLEDGGADIIAIPCNTAHAFVDRIEPYLGIPIVNMLSVTVDYLRETFPSVRNIGVLATSGTIESGVYRTALAASGLNQVAPEPALQARVMAAIYGEKGVKAGFTTGQCQDDIRAAIEGLLDAGIEVMILGCTELPLLVPSGVFIGRAGRRAQLVDPTEVLARRCIAYAGRVAD